MRAVDEEIQARERTVASAMPAVKKQSRELPTVASLTKGTVGVLCSYCQQAHLSNSCQVVSHPNARKQVLQKTVAALYAFVVDISVDSATAVSSVRSAVVRSMSGDVSRAQTLSAAVTSRRAIGH